MNEPEKSDRFKFLIYRRFDGNHTFDIQLFSHKNYSTNNEEANIIFIFFFLRRHFSSFQIQCSRFSGSPVCIRYIRSNRFGLIAQPFDNSDVTSQQRRQVFPHPLMVPIQPFDLEIAIEPVIWGFPLY